MRTHIHTIHKLFCLMLFFLFFSCSGGGESGNESIRLNSYLGAGNIGDVIGYTLNSEDNTYTYTNETTGKSGSGSFTVLDGVYSGVYQIVHEGETNYAIEAGDKIAVTSLPCGNSNTLVFCVSSEQSLSDPAQVAGKYTWIHFAGSTNDYGSFSQWGGFDATTTSFSNGYKYTYGTVYRTNNPADPGFNFNEYFSAASPWNEVTNMGGEGTWWLANNRFNYREDAGISPNQGKDLVGIVLPPGKVMLLDQGEGLGFSIGMAYPSSHPALADIAGDYKYIGVTFGDGGSVLGNFRLNADGSGTSYYKLTANGMEGSVALTNGTELSGVNNMFTFGTSVGSDPALVYLTIMEDGIMMAFTINMASGSEGELVSACVGAKIGE